jgi:hypothetical protein
MHGSTYDAELSPGITCRKLSIVSRTSAGFALQTIAMQLKQEAAASEGTESSLIAPDTIQYRTFDQTFGVGNDLTQKFESENQIERISRETNK